MPLSGALDNDGARTESNNDSTSERVVGFMSSSRVEIIADANKNS